MRQIASPGQTVWEVAKSIGPSGGWAGRNTYYDVPAMNISFSPGPKRVLYWVLLILQAHQVFVFGPHCRPVGGSGRRGGVRK